MNTPEVSVLLPVFNAGRYLQEAIDSICRQSYRDFELLVLDDGSNDNSPQVSEDCSRHDNRIIPLHSDRNLGLSTQLNIGINRARGKYIARMDADDIASENRFEKQVALLEAHPEIGICGSIVQEFSNDTLGGLWDLPQDPDDVASLLFLRCCFSHPSVIMRSSVIKDNGLKYDESFIVAQDYKLWYELLKVTSGYNIQEPLLRYRRFPLQLSQAASPRKLAEVEQIRNTIRNDVGLEENEGASTLHAQIASDHWPDNREWFEHAVDWMNVVYAANLQTQVFPPFAFGKMLAQKLFLHCSMVSKRGLNGWTIYERASFRKHFKPKKYRIATTLIKSLIR